MASRMSETTGGRCTGNWCLRARQLLDGYEDRRSGYEELSNHLLSLCAPSRSRAGDIRGSGLRGGCSVKAKRGACDIHPPSMSFTTTTVSGLDASPGASSSSTTGTEATLRSLYSRAAKSFLNRDIPQTHALITSAFQLVPPPPSTITDADRQLSVWRRKWEILRLTLETTVYSTPPSEAEELPSSIRANLMLSPQSLLASLHTRSLKLFTPWTEGSDGDAGSQRSLSARYLPTQVVVTLVLASMKLNAPEVGKGIVEDWLTGRGDPEEVLEGGGGYEKIIELYCLHLLPRLEEWDLAAEFLQYEGELDVAEKQVRPFISFCILSEGTNLTARRNWWQRLRISARTHIRLVIAHELLRHQHFLLPAHGRNLALGNHLRPGPHQANPVRRQRPHTPPDSRPQKHTRIQS